MIWLVSAPKDKFGERSQNYSARWKLEGKNSLLETSQCSPDSRLSFTENGKGTRDRRKVQKPARTQSEEGSSHPLGGLKPPCHRVRKDTQTSRGEAKDVDQED